MVEFLETINNFIWGVPALILILGVGAYLSIRMGFLQFTLFPRSITMLLQQFRKKNNANGTTPFQALCTALAATVGTGNLAGVAGAICIGGPGAIFWMWVCGFIGMALKYAEATLAVRYQQKNKDGELVGGTMHVIHNGLNSRWHFLAGVYCFFGMLASLGVGNSTQINTVIRSINSAIEVFGGSESFLVNLTLGIVLASMSVVIFTGGAKRIASLSEKLVPIASVIYLLLGIGVLVICRNNIPHALTSIFVGAISPKSVTGGMIGSAFISLRIGASRGVFSNEAGMGTASIAHGASNVSQPAEQGMLGMVEVFLDTLVICTITALVILCSGVAIPYGDDAGITLTTKAFSFVYGDFAGLIIAILACLFACATVVGWGLYGIRCSQYLFGDAFVEKFICFQVIIVLISSVVGSGTIWVLAEIVNGLMIIPNLIAIILLSPDLIDLTLRFKKVRHVCRT